MKFFNTAVIIFSLLMVSQVSGQENLAKKEKQAKSKFKKMNTDKDDAISEKEWADFFEGKTTKKGKAINAEYIFLGTDKNNDKKITLDEMIKGMDKELAKTRKKALNKGKKN